MPRVSESLSPDFSHSWFQISSADPDPCRPPPFPGCSPSAGGVSLTAPPQPGSFSPSSLSFLLLHTASVHWAPSPAPLTLTSLPSLLGNNPALASSQVASSSSSSTAPREFSNLGAHWTAERSWWGGVCLHWW